MTDDQSGGAEDEEWSSVAAAASLFGLSELGFWRLVRSEGFEVRRRGNRPEVRRADIDAYLRRSHPHPVPPPDAQPGAD